MKLKYRPAAIVDIQDACGYIRDKLKNPRAANNLKSRILCAASLLKDSPYMGTPLNSKYDGIETNIRFLIVSKHLVFYEVHDEMIEIVRILDGRTDYLTHLFE